MILPTSPIERRDSPRRRACLGGSLRVAAFLPPVACRLRDLSLTGARIVVPETAILPALLDLTVPCRDRTRRARLVWRSGEQAGLAFLDEPAARVAERRGTDDAAPPVPRRLH